jgi:RNA polymerase sigma-70 factor (ECF subfamily)
LTEDELLTLVLSDADRLKRFALHLCGDPAGAEDLVQEGFLRALASRGQLRDPGRALPWLFSILRRVFLDDHRRAEHRVSLLEAEATSAEPPIGNLEEEMLSRAISDEVASALAALPEEWRTCILLCDVDGFSYEEIAQVVDCPVGTVRSRIARARGRLLVSLQSFAAERGVGPGVRR